MDYTRTVCGLSQVITGFNFSYFVLLLSISFSLVFTLWQTGKMILGIVNKAKINSKFVKKIPFQSFCFLLSTSNE